MRIQGSLARGIVRHLKQAQNGFTIIETMIVLAITGALLASALILIRGQQNRTEFTQTINDVQQQIDDVMNDVVTGFYPNTDNFTCRASANIPLPEKVASGGSAQQGKNLDCIFMGRALQFGVAGTSGGGFNNYTVVGLRQYNDPVNGKRDVATFSEAKPTAVAPGTSSSSNFPDATVSNSLRYGLRVTKMNYYDASNTPQSIAGFVVMGSLAVLNSGTGNLVSGSQRVNIVPIPIGSPGNLNSTPQSFVDQINGLSNSSVINPAGGIVLCFRSGGTSQYGVITIGANIDSTGAVTTGGTGRISTKLTILDSAVATAQGGVCQ